jgi:hypothetical protein
MFLGGVDSADKVRIGVSNYNISNDGSSDSSVDHWCRSIDFFSARITKGSDDLNFDLRGLRVLRGENLFHSKPARSSKIIAE